jgi:signal transduction histidine kinase/DNA-binding response OmpR family regulator
MTQEKPKILIVDDSPENILLIEKLLRKLEVVVSKAYSGDEALRLAERNEFCLGIIDTQMPGMDGYTLAELLRSSEGTATLPIIFISPGFDDNFIPRRGYEAGAVDFMTKPIRAEILLSKVKVFVDLYLQRKTLEKANAVLSKRAVQLHASSQVSQQIASILDLNELLAEVVASIQSQFNYSFVGTWLTSEGEGDEAAKLVLQAGASASGQTPETGISIPMDSIQSNLSQACLSGQARLGGNEAAWADDLALGMITPTQSNLALPLKIGGKSIGVLDIRSQQPNAFDAEDQQVLQALASQITIAIRNALLYEMEKELHQTEEEKAKELARLNKDKDKFFSIISHDLRAPFNILLGNAQFLMKMIDKLSKQDLMDMAQDIYKGARTAYGLLDDLLTWSRLQREEGMKYNPEPIALREMAEEVLQLQQGGAAQKGILLKNEVPENIQVQADRYMLETVLRNLIGNSIKFTARNGKVIISASKGREGELGQLVTITVRDTGVGISAATMEKMFRLDSHLTTIGTDGEQGSGLGLIICKEMVERNGGVIWVESEQGKGTVMSFTLPAAVEVQSA